MASGPITSWQIGGETMETVTDFILGDSKITTDGDCSHEIKRRLLLGRQVMTNLDIKKQRHYFADKGPSSQSYGFSSSHVWTWELDYKESWALKNWCFWTVLLEKTLESPLDCKEIKSVNPKGNQSWIFIGRTNAESWNSNTLATWFEEPTHWKRPWCWEGLRAGGEGDDRGWDGWMATPTQWTWVWVNSGSWWWAGRPGVLWFMGSQRIWTQFSDWTKTKKKRKEMLISWRMESEGLEDRCFSTLFFTWVFLPYDKVLLNYLNFNLAWSWEKWIL